MNMYGQNAALADMPTQALGGTSVSSSTLQAPTESLEAINSEALKCLDESATALENLLVKVRGSQPTQTAGNIAKMPERHVLGDARYIRNLAYEIAGKIQSLHSLI